MNAGPSLRPRKGRERPCQRRVAEGDKAVRNTRRERRAETAYGRKRVVNDPAKH